jgi:proteasome accessory factor B
VTCGVSRRTIFRDIDTLKQVGMPLLFDEVEQRYCIAGAHVLPPTNLTTEEALALIVLCHELGDRQAVAFYQPARRAALKLESSLPARLREHVRGVTGAITINLPPTNVLEGQQDLYQQLVDAAAQKRCVRIEYGSLTEWDDISTKLSPYRVWFSRRSWYVIGRSSIHRQTRTFNLSRIRSAEVLEDTFTIPRGFSIERYLRNAWHMIAAGRDRKVLVRFSKMVAQNVAEVAWHKTQKHSFNEDGTLDFSVTVSGLGEISWWILGYGDQAEVIEPEELRETIVERARNMVALYEAK